MKPNICKKSNSAELGINFLDRKIFKLAEARMGAAVREPLVLYLIAIADAARAMRVEEFFELGFYTRFDIPGVIVEKFVLLVEYADEDGTRRGWLTEDSEPLLWAVYDAAHDLDIDEGFLNDWERLFVALEELRRESKNDLSTVVLDEAASAD